MIDDFILRAAAAGIGLTLATGPLGAFVVWRQMAYFGDATAHAAVLGVAISFAIGMPVFVGTLVVAFAMAITITALSARGQAMSTVLGVLAHSALACGLVAASFVSGLRVDLESFLFGDVLAVSNANVAMIWAGSAVVAGLLVWRWQRLLTATVNAELARASGINPRKEELVLVLALALTVAVSIKIVGALLVAALLIIPAAAARRVARSPETMAVGATAIGALSVVGGLWASMQWDTPGGPSIVVASSILFLISMGFRRLR